MYVTAAMQNNLNRNWRLKDLYAFIRSKQGWILTIEERQPCWRSNENGGPHHSKLPHIGMQIFSATIYSFLMAMTSVGAVDE